jgi:putative Holliday junction resolvase
MGEMEQAYRILALDVGGVRIGLALSDETRTIASPYESYKRKNLEEDMRYILELCAAKNVRRIVSGMPYSMDGAENAQCGRIRLFCGELAKRTAIPIDFCDERFTSLSAERVLLEADVSREGRRQVVDKIAASIILRSYLDKPAKTSG